MLWKELPLHFRLAPSAPIFTSLLETHYFLLHLTVDRGNQTKHCHSNSIFISMFLRYKNLYDAIFYFSLICTYCHKIGERFATVENYIILMHGELRQLVNHVL